MVIVGNDMLRHTVEVGVLLGSPVSPIVFAIDTSRLIKAVEEYVSDEGLSFGDDLGWVATESNINQVITKLEECAAKSIECASRIGLQFDTVKTEAALFTHR